MTSATDRLRALLDERRVRWWEEDGHTLWYGESIHHAASAFSSFMFGENERVHLNAMVTPEQAIDATLGRGTCHIGRGTSGLMHVTTGHCSECGAEVVKPARYCPNCGRKVEP